VVELDEEDGGEEEEEAAADDADEAKIAAAAAAAAEQAAALARARLAARRRGASSAGARPARAPTPAPAPAPASAQEAEQQRLHQAPLDADAAELTMSEQGAFIGSIALSPIGMPGFVLGGAIGFAAGLFAERVDQVRARVSVAYAAVVKSEARAVANQEHARDALQVRMRHQVESTFKIPRCRRASVGREV